MLRLLTKKDHDIVWNFLKAEASINLYAIGNIENFGYNQEFQQLWGWFEEGILRATMMRYYSHFMYYAKKTIPIEPFVHIIQDFNEAYILSGKTKLVEPFEQFLESTLLPRRDTYFSEWIASRNEHTVLDAHVIQADIEDIDDILSLESKVPEFGSMNTTYEMIEQTFYSKTGRTFFIKENGKMIASVSTEAENSLSAMIIGVCTHPNYRGRGLASRILSHVLTILSQEGKIVCLFYNNPSAGTIYKRLGFYDIDMWTMYH